MASITKDLGIVTKKPESTGDGGRQQLPEGVITPGRDTLEGTPEEFDALDQYLRDYMFSEGNEDVRLNSREFQSGLMQLASKLAAADSGSDAELEENRDKYLAGLIDAGKDMGVADFTVDQFRNGGPDSVDQNHWMADFARLGEGYDDAMNWLGGGIDWASDKLIGDAIIGTLVGEEQANAFKDRLTGEDFSIVPKMAVDLGAFAINPILGMAVSGGTSLLDSSDDIYGAASGYDWETGKALTDQEQATKGLAAGLMTGLSVLPGIGAVRGASNVLKGGIGGMADDAAKAGEKYVSGLQKAADDAGSALKDAQGKVRSAKDLRESISSDLKEQTGNLQSATKTKDDYLAQRNLTNPNKSSVHRKNQAAVDDYTAEVENLNAGLANARYDVRALAQEAVPFRKAARQADNALTAGKETQSTFGSAVDNLVARAADGGPINQARVYAALRRGANDVSLPPELRQVYGRALEQVNAPFTRTPFNVNGAAAKENNIVDRILVNRGGKSSTEAQRSRLNELLDGKKKELADASGDAKKSIQGEIDTIQKQIDDLGKPVYSAGKAIQNVVQSTPKPAHPGRSVIGSMALSPLNAAVQFSADTNQSVPEAAGDFGNAMLQNPLTAAMMVLGNGRTARTFARNYLGGYAPYGALRATQAGMGADALNSGQQLTDEDIEGLLNWGQGVYGQLGVDTAAQEEEESEE